VPFLLAALVVIATTKPQFVCTSSPKIGFADIATGGLQVRLNCELTGSETEELYCPTISWEFPDGTKSVSESDCQPYSCGRTEWCHGQFDDYERHWSKYLLAGPGSWVIRIRLMKNNKTIRASSIEFEVR
jgi:hypothetical protein